MMMKATSLWIIIFVVVTYEMKRSSTFCFWRLAKCYIIIISIQQKEAENMSYLSIQHYLNYLLKNHEF